jgi:hypothetical protein
MTIPPEPLSAELRAAGLTMRAALAGIPDHWRSIPPYILLLSLVDEGLIEARPDVGNYPYWMVRRTPAGRAALKASADD